MNEELFWKIIQQTLQAKTQKEQIDLLSEALRKIPATDVSKFDTIFNQARKKFPYKTSLLRQLLNDEGYFISDDSWIYFTCWLIMHGKPVYEQALHTPEQVLSLVEKEAIHSENIIGQKYVPAFEEAWYVAIKVLEEIKK